MRLFISWSFRGPGRVCCWALTGDPGCTAPCAAGGLDKLASLSRWSPPTHGRRLSTEPTRPCVQDTTALSRPCSQAFPASAHPRVAVGGRADPACPFLPPVLGGVRSSGAGTRTSRPANNFCSHSRPTVSWELHRASFWIFLHLPQIPCAHCGCSVSFVVTACCKHVGIFYFPAAELK